MRYSLAYLTSCDEICMLPYLTTIIALCAFLKRTRGIQPAGGRMAVAEEAPSG